MENLKELCDRIITFRDARNWKQFHNPKDAAISLVLEANELLEHMQWRNGSELTSYLQKEQEAVSDELADVLYWVLLLAHDLGIDIGASFRRKMEKNEAKYPIAECHGRHLKYDQLKTKPRP